MSPNPSVRRRQRNRRQRNRRQRRHYSVAFEIAPLGLIVPSAKTIEQIARMVSCNRDHLRDCVEVCLSILCLVIAIGNDSDHRALIAELCTFSLEFASVVDRFKHFNPPYGVVSLVSDSVAMNMLGDAHTHPLNESARDRIGVLKKACNAIAAPLGEQSAREYVQRLDIVICRLEPIVIGRIRGANHRLGLTIREDIPL